MIATGSSRVVGAALLGFGALIFTLSFWSSTPSTLRTAGPVVAFFGIVVLAQARPRGGKR